MTTTRDDEAAPGDSTIAAFLVHLEKERDLSPHTVRAYGRDLRALARYLSSYYGGGDWSWERVDRLTIRGFLAHLTRSGLGKRSMARALSAVRQLLWIPASHRCRRKQPGASRGHA